jgi:hypothetical protein
MLTSLQSLRVRVGRSCSGQFLRFSTSRLGELIHIRNLWQREQNLLKASLQQVKDCRAGYGCYCPPLSVSNLQQDPSDDTQSFKMRPIYRDKGCAVCLAAGIQKIYEYYEDSNCYKGTHIVDFVYHELVSHCLCNCQLHF